MFFTFRRLMLTCLCLLLSMAGMNRADETLPTSDASPNAADLGTQSQAREAVLNSAAWKRAEQAFNDWLSVQTIYSKPQVEYLKAQFRDNTSKMSATELKAFLDQMELKLDILLSSDVTEARSWVGSRMSVLATHKREELQKQLPDVVNMTAAQLEQYLYKFEQKRQTSQQADQAAHQFRQMQTQQIQQSVQAQQASVQQARQRGQKAVANQATRQVQQGFQDSMQNARYNSWDPNRYRGLVVPAAAYFDGGYRW